MNKNCNTCNKEFRVSPSRSTAKYCSYACKSKSQLGKQPINMEGLKLGHGWNKGLHIQSNSALDKWRENGGIPWNKTEWIIKSCLRCEKEFSVPPCRENTANYCSLTCYSKGEEVGYNGLHKWVQRHLGKPDTCEHCGKSGLSSRDIHWANKSGEYKRDLDDWIRLCKMCHNEYDKGKNDIERNFVDGGARRLFI